jgi:hypothetical protein
MTCDGDISYILGMKIQRDRTLRTVTLSNEKKTVELLQEANMHRCQPIGTPMEAVTVSSQDCPTLDSEEHHEMLKTPYREVVGKLIFLMRTTRPEIAFSVSIVSRFMHNPGRRHWQLVKRILRYLNGTRSYGLTLSPTSLGFSMQLSQNSITLQGPSQLHGNVDADFGGNTDDAKSTSGYAFFLGASLISWCSKAQRTTATSSTQAEYIAAYHGATETNWLRSFLQELNQLDPNKATTIYCDNEAAIKLAQYHMVTPRSKSFDTKYHYLREQVEEGTIILTFCPGKDNVADIFTKPLSQSKFTRFRAALGVGPPISENLEHVEPLGSGPLDLYH